MATVRMQRQARNSARSDPARAKAHMRVCTHPLCASSIPNVASLVVLGGEVELQVAILGPLHVVLHKEWCIGAETNLDLAAERRGLREVDEVAERKGGGDILMDRQDNLVLGLLGLAWLQHHIANTNVALDAKGDALLPM